MIRNSLISLATAFVLGFGFAGVTNAERSAVSPLWRVTLPDLEGKDRQVAFTITKNGLRVYQRCLPFSVNWGQSEKVQIQEPEMHVMCVTTPLHEITTMAFFANLKVAYASDHHTVILVTMDNELIEATYFAPTPDDGRIIWD